MSTHPCTWAALNPPVRLRLQDVLRMGKFSRSTLYARIAEGKFPPPRKDGRMSWWPFDEVVEALQLRAPSTGDE